MTQVAALFVRTFVIGIAVAAPVGAMGVLCIQRTLDCGRRAGVVTGLGIATADAFYAGCAAFGVTTLAAVLAAWQTPLRLVGGGALVCIGVWSALHAPAENTAPPGPARTRHASLYLSAVALTLTNPMTIMAFGAIFASAGLTVAPSPAAAGVATLGVALGSLTWWIALTSVVSAARHGLSSKAVMWVSRVSGAAVAVFGVLAVISALAPAVG